MQVTTKARQQDQNELVEELGALAKAVADSEGW